MAEQLPNRYREASRGGSDSQIQNSLRNIAASQGMAKVRISPMVDQEMENLPPESGLASIMSLGQSPYVPQGISRSNPGYVPVSGSEVDPNSPLGIKMGLSRPKEAPSQAVEPAPTSEMDMIKQRLGFSGNVDRDSSNNVAARNAFLSHGSSGFGMQDYVPESDTGGDYLAIMARDGQNDAIRAANHGIVSRAQENDAIRQAEIQNSLKQDAAYQKMEIEAQEAAQDEEFFRASGVIPSPQAMVEFQKQRARQRATSDYASTASGLAKEYSDKIRQLYRGYENVEEGDLPPSIVRGRQIIDKEYADKEHNMMLLTGMISDVNDPGKLIPKETPGLQ